MKLLDDIMVLIVEDERPVRMLMRVVLEAAGARVVEAEHGAVALRLLELHPEIAVVCTDVNMPVLDGVGLAASLRVRRPLLPLVACSALDVAERHPALAAQAHGLVQKPFVPSELVRAVHAAAVAGREITDAAAS